MAVTPSSPSYSSALDSGEGGLGAFSLGASSGFATCALPLGSCACQSGASCLLLCLKAASSELCPLACCAALFSPTSLRAPYSRRAHQTHVLTGNCNTLGKGVPARDVMVSKGRATERPSITHGSLDIRDFPLWPPVISPAAGQEARMSSRSHTSWARPQPVALNVINPNSVTSAAQHLTRKCVLAGLCSPGEACKVPFPVDKCEGHIKKQFLV